MARRRSLPLQARRQASAVQQRGGAAGAHMWCCVSRYFNVKPLGSGRDVVFFTLGPWPIDTLCSTSLAARARAVNARLCFSAQRYASFAEDAQLCFSAQRLISPPPPVRTCAQVSDKHQQCCSSRAGTHDRSALHV